MAGIKIFHYAGCLNFASHDNFKKILYRLVNFEEKSAEQTADQKHTFHSQPLKCVIIDLSCLTYIDASGVKTLQSIADSMENAKIDVLLATSSSPVFEQLKTYEKHSSIHFRLFPTIHDAVRFAYQATEPIKIVYDNLAYE